MSRSRNALDITWDDVRDSPHGRRMRLYAQIKRLTVVLSSILVIGGIYYCFKDHTKKQNEPETITTIKSQSSARVLNVKRKKKTDSSCALLKRIGHAHALKVDAQSRSNCLD